MALVKMSRARRTYSVSLLCASVGLLFADQNILAPNLTEIANEFGFTMKEKNEKLGSDISIGFFVIGRRHTTLTTCLILTNRAHSPNNCYFTKNI